MNRILRALPAGLTTTIAAAAWLALLFLPFKGLLPAVTLFVALVMAAPLVRFSVARTIAVRKKLEKGFGGLSRYLRHRYSVPAIMIPLGLLPLVGEGYVLDVAIVSGIYIILALGLNVVVGFAGLLNLGFAAYYAIGSYSYALLNTKLGLGFWTCLPLSVFLTTLAGFLFAVPALRLRGDYLALVTLGLGEIVRIVLNNWDSFTKGPNGITGISGPQVFAIPLDTPPRFYYLVLLFVVIAVFLIRRVHQSKIGRAWEAIREDEVASSAMGINATRYKLYSVAFGACWAGLAGCLFAAKMRFISPESFTFMESVLILCMVIIGGLGSIAGVIVGAVLLVFLPEVLREVQLYRMLALGGSLVLLMIFRPQGLFGGRGVFSRG